MNVTVISVEHLGCGCIIATQTRVVVFARDDCAHDAGQRVRSDDRYAEWREHGAPVA